MRDLRGTVAWVTGAGSGIGRAIALGLGAAGCHVVLTGRRQQPLEATLQAIGSLGGGGSIEIVDVAISDDVVAAADRILGERRRVDILVNAAGLNVPQRHWDEVSPEGFDRVLDTDLGGCFYTVRAVLPTMRAQQDGLIVNIGSWLGLHASYLGGPAYSAAKRALAALTESLNLEEFQYGIRACCLSPGEVATPMLESRPVKPSSEVRALMLQPEDIAEIVLLIARLPSRVCVNEVIVSPTWNRFYLGDPETVTPRRE